MRTFKIEAVTAVGLWALSSACASVPLVSRGASLYGYCPSEIYETWGNLLSDEAEIYFPGSDEFTAATLRWSALSNPTISAVLVPATESDVEYTVQFANTFNVPFLAYNTRHGAMTTLGDMTWGISILLNNLSSVTISDDGLTATIGGGTSSKTVTDDLWDAGKQAVTGTCECVSLMGPGLGGGHGWLQGHYGLVSDQFVSMRVVLASGEAVTVSETENTDLFWAMRGAGHNYGIVTSVTTKIYDIDNTDWAIETIIFDGDKVEEVYQAANDYLLMNGTQPVDIINWSYWLNIPAFDADKPVIMMYIIQEGVTAVDSTYTQPFHNIGALSIDPQSGTYLDLAGWTGISETDGPCLKTGDSNPRFPLYLDTYDVTAMAAAYDLFAASVGGDGNTFSNSIFMFEGYSMQALQAFPDDTSAFAHRSSNLLIAPLLSYTPVDDALDAEAAEIGNALRQILHDASGRTEMASYVNYGYGNEGSASWYGSDNWRQTKLLEIKDQYDPNRQFSFFGPVA